MFTDHIVKELTNDINQYDKIYLINIEQSLGQEIIRQFDILEDRKSILIISKYDLYADGNVVFKKVSDEEYNIFFQIYSLYEFSDKFELISNDERFGSIWNYVKTGILTIKEVARIFLDW